MPNYLKGVEKGVYLMLSFYFLGLIISLFYMASPSYNTLTNLQTLFNVFPIILSIFGLVLGFNSALNGEQEDKKQEQRQ